MWCEQEKEREKERDYFQEDMKNNTLKKKLEKIHSWAVQLEVELWYFSHVGRNSAFRWNESGSERN